MGLFGNNEKTGAKTNLTLYCVYDLKNGKFGPPFTAVNDLEAARYFDYLCTKPGLMQSFRADFGLYNIGGFDDSTGTLSERPPVAIPVS